MSDTDDSKTERRINFRPPAEIDSLLRAIAQEEFAGNVSRLINTYLADRLRADGRFESESESDKRARRMKLLEELAEAGVDVDNLLAEAFEKQALEKAPA